MNDVFLWEKLIPTLNEGLWLSLRLIIPSALFGFSGGIVFGVLRVYGSTPIRRFLDMYVALFRGIPLLLQLYFLYNVLPRWGIMLNAYQASVLGFFLCSAAYQSEYVRGALLSIRQGQTKAALSLGFTKSQMLTNIIIPQAFRRALPGCGNEIIYLIKYSSLAHTITFLELTGLARDLASRSFFYIQVFALAGLYYLFLTTVAACLLGWVEKRLKIPGLGAV